jgi:hypothetical protein
MGPAAPLLLWNIEAAGPLGGCDSGTDPGSRTRFCSRDTGPCNDLTIRSAGRGVGDRTQNCLAFLQIDTSINYLRGYLLSMVVFKML